MLKKNVAVFSFCYPLEPFFWKLCWNYYISFHWDKNKMEKWKSWNFYFLKYCHLCVCCYLYLSINRSLFVRFCFCGGIFLHIFFWWCSLCCTGRRDWEKTVWRKSNFIGFSKTTHGSGTQYETVSWQSFLFLRQNTLMVTYFKMFISVRSILLPSSEKKECKSLTVPWNKLFEDDILLKAN